MFNGVGSCLPPQLPPLPPPPQFFSPMSPPNWTTYGAFPGHSFSFPPPPFPPPPQAHQTAGILPRPPYNASSPVFGRGGRGRNGGGGSNRNNGHKWKIQRCDSCDRVYKSEETFTEHLQSHVKCDQCDFTALPKKVKEHSQVHSLPDFLSFSSQDDIEKWRDQRKRNYPTLSNVTKKKKCEEERRARGQVVDTPLYRYVNRLIGDYDSKSRGRGRGGRRGGHRGRQNRSGFTRQSEHSKTETDFNNTSSVAVNVATPTTPIVSVTPHSNVDDTPSASDTSNVNVATPTTSIVSVTPHSNVDDTPSASDTSNINGASRQGKGRKRRNNNKDRTKQTHPLKKQCHWTEVSLPSQPTLLEKLLASTVRCEHNAILQCVKYTVRKDFFQPIKDNSDNSPT